MIQNFLNKAFLLLGISDDILQTYSITTKEDMLNAQYYNGTYFLYMLVNDNNIDYIGITRSLKTRLSVHKRQKIFQQVLLLTFSDYNKMCYAEKELIEFINPKLNSNFNNL